MIPGVLSEIQFGGGLKTEAVLALCKRDLSRFGVPGARPTGYACFQSQSGSFWSAPRENDLHIHR